MWLKVKILSILFLTVFIGLFSAKSVFASTFTLSGNVSGSGSPLPDTTITVTDSNTSANAGSTTTDSSGNYSLVVMDGTYNVTATPPTSSGFQSVTQSNQVISGDTTLNFTLVTITSPVTLSGHITDQNGAAIAGATVELNGGLHNTFDGGTDSSGFYSVTAPAGSYKLVI